MGEAIISRRGGSEEAIITFTDYTPQNLILKYDADGQVKHFVPSSRLSVKGQFFASATLANKYVIFTGGAYSKYWWSIGTANAFDENLTRYILEDISSARNSMAGAGVGNYALFAGGVKGDTRSNVVDVYDISLTRLSPLELSTSRSGLAGASLGLNYAIFGSGPYSNGTDAFDSSLIRITLSPLDPSGYVRYSSAVGTNNHVIFAGGDRSIDNMPVAYNSSLTRITLTPLSLRRSSIAGAKAGDISVFAGGVDNDADTVTDIVDAYNSNLTKVSVAPLSNPKSGTSRGTHAGNYAIISGSSITDIYHESLVHSVCDPLYDDRSGCKGGTTGKYAIFAGGDSTRFDTEVDFLDAYFPEGEFAIFYVPVGTRYKFGTSGEVEADTTEIIVKPPINGYIKYKKGVVS